VINGGHYYLQMEWSNNDGGCRAHDEADQISFGVTHHPARGRKVTFTAKANDPDGKIVAFDWHIGKRVRHGRRVTLKFGQPGSYKVVLKTVDLGRNWAYSTRTIRVFKR
jgi:hypothetical protein